MLLYIGGVWMSSSSHGRVSPKVISLFVFLVTAVANDDISPRWQLPQNWSLREIPVSDIEESLSAQPSATNWSGRLGPTVQSGLSSLSANGISDAAVAPAQWLPMETKQLEPDNISARKLWENDSNVTNYTIPVHKILPLWTKIQSACILITNWLQGFSFKRIDTNLPVKDHLLQARITKKG